jgi:hypothetical protein
MGGYIQNGAYMYDEDRYDCAEKDQGGDREDCCAPKHPAPKGILLECGCNPQDAIFETKHDCDKRDQTFVLDSVIVDTTCLCRPVVKIEFSSIVYFEAKTTCGCEKEIEVDLLFELIRNCKGAKEIVRSWRYKKEFEIERDDKLEVEISEPFTVTFCDRVCPECCEYKMIVKAKDFEGDFEALRVIQPNLSALAQGLCDDCR